MNEITLTMDRFMELIEAEKELMELKHPKTETTDCETIIESNK